MNLSMLGFFKYGNFLLENFQWLLARIGIVYHPPHLDILLPVGISFYTFHSLSYTLDIYRGVLKPTKSLRDFVLAVSFFPQLVAITPGIEPARLAGFESQIIAGLTAEETAEWYTSAAAAKADDTFFIASPFHCAVGTKAA